MGSHRYVLAVWALACLLAACKSDSQSAGSSYESGGWTTSARVSAATATPGSAVTISATVTAQSDQSALVDVEVQDGAGRRLDQRSWDGVAVRADEVRTVHWTWTVPPDTAPGALSVKVGVFSPGWGALAHWNDAAATFSVVAGTSPKGRFPLLPVGSAFPSDEDCAARVRPAPEVRPENETANHTKGTVPNGRYPRVTGDFTGTTDEIIQWAACKWGIDEDMARAQAAKESWWFQSNEGDWTTDPNVCPPAHGIGADDEAGKCPESMGLLQVRFQYHAEAFVDRNAEMSTAYNIDYTYAVWRDCYEGNLTWLNDVDRGATYAAGDPWGCMGVWFSGRWYTGAADGYIDAVEAWYEQRIWESGDFLHP